MQTNEPVSNPNQQTSNPQTVNNPATTETPQPTQPIAELKPTNWPKVVLVAVLGIGLLAGSAYAGYWYGTQQAQQIEKLTAVSQPTPTPTSTPTPPVRDETADWKTYTDKPHGISFKYPPDWEIQPLSDWEIEPTTPEKEDELTIRTLVKIAPQDFAMGEQCVILFYVDNPENLSLEMLDKKLTGPSEKIGSNVSLGLYSQSAVPVTLSDGTTAYFEKNSFCEPVLCQRYTWSYKNRVYQLINYPREILSQAQIFDQIFSTFKFIN